MSVMYITVSLACVPSSVKGVNAVEEMNECPPLDKAGSLNSDRATELSKTEDSEGTDRLTRAEHLCGINSRRLLL